MFTFRKVNTEASPDDPQYEFAAQAMDAAQELSEKIDEVLQVINEHGDPEWLVWGGWIYSL